MATSLKNSKKIFYLQANLALMIATLILYVWTLVQPLDYQTVLDYSQPASATWCR